MSQKRSKLAAALLALLAALLYALSTPESKVLLGSVAPAMLAALLYLGAGVGVGAMFLVDLRRPDRQTLLSRSDLPYTIGMIVLDIAAPILLMFGLSGTSAASAALLNNFEIVATSVIALVVFREAVSRVLWTAITFITLASALLSVEDVSELRFSWGAGLILAAALCWGLENNCTRRISAKNTFEIVALKGVFSGLGSLAVALLAGERLPAIPAASAALALGFVAYGLSIFLYIRAQSALGAAKTSAFYAVAPFAGALLSFVFLGEPLTRSYLAALAVMLAGSALAVADTLVTYHTHAHVHHTVHVHDGETHDQEITHSHAHIHFGDGEKHAHRHLPADRSRL